MKYVFLYAEHTHTYIYIEMDTNNPWMKPQENLLGHTFT